MYATSVDVIITFLETQQLGARVKIRYGDSFERCESN
jgi:hypothetical protein